MTLASPSGIGGITRLRRFVDRNNIFTAFLLRRQLLWGPSRLRFLRTPQLCERRTFEVSGESDARYDESATHTGYPRVRGNSKSRLHALILIGENEPRSNFTPRPSARLIWRR
jgi:hypothetical protein